MFICTYVHVCMYARARVCVCVCVQLVIDLVSHYVLINVFNNFYDLDYDKCVARSGSQWVIARFSNAHSN